MVLPIRDVIPTRRTPWVTWALLALNIAIFVFVEPWNADACTQQRFFLTWAAVPAELTQGEPLDAREVATTTPAECAVAPVPQKDVYLAALYSLFLHAGWGHLLGNMLYLWIFGNNVEDRLGHVRFLLFYLAAGFVATLAFVLWQPSSPVTLVGASGAIAGVLGAYLIMFPLSRLTVILPPLFFLPFRLPAVLVLVQWFVLQLLGAGAARMSGTNVAYLAHAGGFVAGVVYTLATHRSRMDQREAYVPRW